MRDLHGGRTWAEVVRLKDAKDHSQPNGNRGPLPWWLQRLREETFSVFVSKLPQHISRTEAEAIFCRAERVVDQRSRNSRGFAFVRFETKREAENAVEQRSWGRRKVHANLAQFQTKKGGRGQTSDLWDW